MEKKDLHFVVKKFYEALDEGKVLGRKCTKCDHVEFPPYLACNACGNLDTEWVEISGKAVATQLVPIAMAFTEPSFASRIGDYVLATVKPENSDEYNTCLLGVKAEQIEELVKELPLPVKPVIRQLDEYKMVFWELDKN